MSENFTDMLVNKKIQAALESINTLRSLGYAVVTFHPDELREADPNRVEDRLVEMGWDVINWLSPMEEEENEV
jgi:hypothetical protein